MRTAARMFAERPYHEVRLDEIAAAARLGKGTIYVYFASKDDLHTTLIAEGIDQLVAELKAPAAGGEDAWPAVERAVFALLAFADRFPHLYTLMRSGQLPQEGRLVQKRGELASALTRILRRGVQCGTLDDPHPQLTAEFVLSFVRVAMLFPPRNLGRKAISRHILRVLGRGLLASKKRPKR
jgi:AcrR family transcriptional regulator